MWVPPPPAPVAPSSGRSAPVAAGPLALGGGLLLAAAAALHVASLFPGQGAGVGPQSAEASLVVVQVIVAAGWLAAAALVVTRRPRLGVAGTAVAVGLALAEVGLVISDLGQVLAAGSLGAGLWLLAAGWLAGALGAGSGVIAYRLRAFGGPARVAVHKLLGPLTAVAAVVLGVALLPAWDSYVLDLRAAGRLLTVTAGDAFASSTPGVVLAGDIVAAVAFAAVPIAAAVWRPGRIGALVSGGVLVVVAGQIASAVAGFRITNPLNLASPADVRAYDIVVSGSSLTPWFDAEVVAAVALLVLLVARWWTPDGGSLLASYPYPGSAASAPGFQLGAPWLYGSTAPRARGSTGGGPYGPPEWPPSPAPQGSTAAGGYPQTGGYPPPGIYPPAGPAAPGTYPPGTYPPPPGTYPPAAPATEEGHANGSVWARPESWGPGSWPPAEPPPSSQS